jgi:Holliday junction resolvase
MASTFQIKIKKKMEQKGYKVLSVIKLSQNGFPDLLCLKDGRSVWIECKEKNDTLKPLQKYRIDELINNGFEAYCLQDTKGQIYP